MKQILTCDAFKNYRVFYIVVSDMEIERKWLMDALPHWINGYSFYEIEQGYISVDPVIRIRRKNDSFILTVKGSGRIAREEFEAELSREAFYRLSAKCDGILITKRRYTVPVERDGSVLLPYENGIYTAEIDAFSGAYAGLCYAEIEFPSVDEAESFVAPEWFGTDVSEKKGYSNAELSMGNAELMRLLRNRAADDKNA